MQSVVFLCLFFSGFLFILDTPSYAEAEVKATYSVVIDPGHGGRDIGASLNSIQESQVTLQISKKIKDLFKNKPEFDIHLTREENKVVPLFERIEFAKKLQADLFLSIHANSSPDLSARGAEFYIQSQMPADEETLFLANRENSETGTLQNSTDKGDLSTIIEDLQKTGHVYSSQIFSETLLKKWTKQFRVRPQSIRQGPFRVLMGVPMPSVLIETGFITNEKDREDLTNSQQQNKIAEIIYNAVLDFKEKMDKGHFSGHSISHANR